MKHPIQPLYTDDQKVVRFKQNAIVRYLLDQGPFDLNQLAMLPFSDEDREQFAQLIGYSLSGFGDLSYVKNETYVVAEEMFMNPKHQKKDAAIEHLSTELETLRDELRDGIARLYGIHPDDLA